MNNLTLSDAKNDRGLKTVTGVCSSSADFLSYVNEATAKCYRRGDFPGTLAQVQVCSADGCFAAPEFIGRIRELNVCNQPMPLKNQWHSYLLFGPGTRHGCGHSDLAAVEMGYSPVFKNVPCANQNCYVRVYPRVQADLGKTITIFGTDTNGNEVMTKVDGTTWVSGQKLTLALPFVSTTTTFRTVTRVSKDKTAGYVDLYFYDSVKNVLLDGAHYKPLETEPAYAMYRLTGIPGRCGTACNGIRSVQILFKMALNPLIDDDDILPIQNIEAVKWMVAAIKKREAGDLRGSEESELAAVHELNLWMRDDTADEQIPVDVAIYGSAHLWKKRIGQIV